MTLETWVYVYLLCLCRLCTCTNGYPLLQNYKTYDDDNNNRKPFPNPNLGNTVYYQERSHAYESYGSPIDNQGYGYQQRIFQNRNDYGPPYSIPNQRQSNGFKHDLSQEKYPNYNYSTTQNTTQLYQPTEAVNVENPASNNSSFTLENIDGILERKGFVIDAVVYGIGIFVLAVIGAVAAYKKLANKRSDPKVFSKGVCTERTGGSKIHAKDLKDEPPYETIPDNVYDLPDLLPQLNKPMSPHPPRPLCPLPLEARSGNEKYIHYDTPYEDRIFRMGKLKCLRATTGQPRNGK